MAAGSLLELLTLTDAGGDSYTAPPPAPEGTRHVFGGHVAAQAVRAAGHTVETGLLPHSVHAYFVRAGESGVPVDLAVERVRDGRSFSLRRVVASQRQSTILVLDVSFHVEESGRIWPGPLVPSIPGPDDCAGNRTYLTELDWLAPFELRPVQDDAPAAHPFWVRARESLPDDPVLHACVLVGIADIGVAGAAVGLRPFAGRIGPSLDHCVWVRGRCRVDEWLLFEVGPRGNAGARGLAAGTIVDRSGVLVADVVQEVLLREDGPPQPAR